MPIQHLRRALLLVLLGGLLGTGAELLLLEHTEDAWQLVPLALIGLAVLAVVWHARRPSGPSRWTVAGAMALSSVSGLAGVLLHYQSNVEFELELDASLVGLALVRDALMGATPALAPGAMTLLGCLGLLWISTDRELPTPTP